MAPAPWMSVLTVRLLPGLAFGMVTFGVWPNAPVAVTAVFAPGEEEAADADEDDEAVDFDDPPQPARTTQASRGMAMSARKRRMKTSMVVDVSLVSLLVGPSGHVSRQLACSELSAFTATQGYIPAMSFSTRSSTERNGSLHS